MNINDRLLKFIDLKSISKREFYLKTGLSNGFLDKSSNIGSDKVEKIISIYPELSLEWLMLGKGDMISVPNSVSNSVPIDKKRGFYDHSSINHILNEHPEEYIRGKNLRILPITVDVHGKETIKYVPLMAHAGYLDGFRDPDFVENLPNMSITGFSNGTFRVFEIKGDSMETTLQSSDRVIGKYIEDFTKCRSNEVYIIITRSDGIVAKRIMNYMSDTGGFIQCFSDNEDYSMYTIDALEILEMWHLEAIIRTNIKSTGSIKTQLLKIDQNQAKK